MPGKNSKSHHSVVLHVVSDATGNLASHMIHAVITQFPGVDFQIIQHVFQREPNKLRETIDGMEGRNHLVLHALLDSELKRLIHELCREKRIDDFDLTGSLVQFIADHTHTAPVNDLARLHHTGEGYFRRIRAMEFTAQHDDNRRIDTIGEADIVLVGLSRVSKSPTSTWLGAMGYKVANVAIAREIGFPKELEAVKERTVALTIRPKALCEIRKRRFEGVREKIDESQLEDLPYYNLRSVVSEVAWVEKEFRKRGYPILDITDRTVEEVSVLVLAELNLQDHDVLYRH
jgi:regulator of PEP synthase PpsR (kinase-PPPase family)